MEKKGFSSPMGFILDLEKTLNILSENKGYDAKIGKIIIRYDGEVENKLEGKRQLFSIIRKVD